MLLEREQEELLAVLCEAARRLPREKRSSFMFFSVWGGSFIRHDGLPDGNFKEFHDGDLSILERAGLVYVVNRARHDFMFEVTPEGFDHYRRTKQAAKNAVAQVEGETRAYIEADHFRARFTAAHAKWAGAERLLWSSDNEHDVTTVGHLCREAMQEFASALLDARPVENVDPDVTHTENRVRAVVTAHAPSSERVRAFLDALVEYWRKVSDLAQRQEHGAQKEGEPLGWEDARRLVFQTLNVMYEVSRALNL